MAVRITNMSGRYLRIDFDGSPKNTKGKLVKKIKAMPKVTIEQNGEFRVYSELNLSELAVSLSFLEPPKRQS